MIYNTENNGFRNRLGESVLLKLLLIGLLTLLLLIPSVWIQNLISERQGRQNEVVKEISDKWSGNQQIDGPVMILPYKTLVSEKDKTGNYINREIIIHIYLLPEVLNIVAKAHPETLHRGIFDAVVYDSQINVSGKFSELELRKSGINPDMVMWNKARVAIGLSDIKGLKNNPAFHLADSTYEVEPDFNDVQLFKNNLVALADLSIKKNTALAFNLDLDLRGSNELSFMHLGKSTNVKVEGTWNDPSFTGKFLPENRKISKDGFTAEWKMPYFNRAFPQQWIEENASLQNKDSEASFGVMFLLPVDQYQKTMRSAKYATLIVLLTFVALFFIEFLSKTKIHLLQYVLIGAAMIIYYTLLLSFSEQIGFNAAYLVASLATITLISTFISALLKNKKTALAFSGILSIFYGFIFIIIQLQDLSLLFGSIGLFIVVAVMMYLSAKLDWNPKKNEENHDE